MFFSYKVFDKEGKELRGRIEASNRTNAISLLQSRGYVISELKNASDSSVLDIKLFQRVRTGDLLFFTRQMSTLFSTGVSALRAFSLVAENTRSNFFKSILHEITRDIERGLSVDDAFKKHPEVFEEFFVSIISVGVQSGTLSRSFKYLGDHLERKSDIEGKVQKALVYPIVIVVLFIAVIILMLVTVIPQISTILTQSGAELPVFTKVVIASSDFMTEHIWIILGVILATALLSGFYVRTEDGKKWLDETILSVPLVGRLAREYNLIQMTSNLSVMLGSGVSLVPALETVERVVQNTHYKLVIAQISKDVRVGNQLSQAVGNQPIIGKNVALIIKVGEETGELNKMFDVITEFYRKQLHNTIDVLLDLIQPIIIVALGLTVGVLIGSVILPIYSLTGSI